MPVSVKIWEPKTKTEEKLWRANSQLGEMERRQQEIWRPPEFDGTEQWQSPSGMTGVSQVQMPREEIEEFTLPEYVLPEPKTQKRLVMEAQKAQRKKEPLVQVPFWQRSLQVFVAPFEWVDENIIRPGLALTGTTVGFVPEVERRQGEDFWEWKKRSWTGWQAPGFNVNVPWSDEPWRVDMKGVMEIAPWLLIPGAGQVGTATRAGVGFAGILSKAGKVGRVLGTAVEYSPWGLVEKTAGVAIKGGVRAIGKVSERVSTAVGEKLYGKYVPPPTPAVVTKLGNYLKQVVLPSYRAFRKEVPTRLRARQSSKLEAVQESYRRGEIPYEKLKEAQDIARYGALHPEFDVTAEALATRQERAIANVEARVVSGEITKSVGNGLITKIRKNPAFTAVPFTNAEGKELNDFIISSVENQWMKAEEFEALTDLIFNGKLPFPYIVRGWRRVFGDEFAKIIGQLRTVPQDKVSQMLDTLNIGRALLAAMDLSGTGRQGLILGLLHPTQVPKWFSRQVKALFSEKWAYEIDDAMRADLQFREVIGATGAYIAPIRDATLTGAEELFASRAARRIPGVRRSERAFITYLNQARYTALKDGYNGMVSQGATPEQLKLFGQFVDYASGRGRIPKSIEKFSPVLNATLFSPRLQAATLQLPRQIGRMIISGNPYMRKEAGKALATFVGGGVGLLSLINATGNKVEIDPRSGDFGKIKIGETRLDIWRGYLQYIRFASQLLTGERKSAYGNMNKAERSEIVSRFLQSKASPAIGLLADLLRGETYMGDPIFSDTTGFSKAARERVIPLAVQDIIDAMEQSGVNGMWTAAPAMLGVGALTYVNDFVRVKQKIAREMGYDTWDEIDPKTQREIENRNTELQAATIELDRRVMGTAWGDWKLAGNAIEDVFRQNVDNAVAQYQQSTKPNRGYQFNEKVKGAFSERRGAYDVREQEARFEDIAKRLKVQDPMEALVTLGPKQLAIKIYNDSLFGDDMYDEFGDYRFDEASIRKEELRRTLGDEKINYIEDYRELKFETFPPEFQELMRAKELMRPYWEIRNRVVKLFGERYAESSGGQALISKMRKQKRMSNPEMERYYQQFYAGR